jgi:nucleotide-binding universal stress UspA family protein
MVKNLLVPTDFSEHAERALVYACELADRLGATVHLVSAIGTMAELEVTLTTPMLTSLRRDREAALAELAQTRAQIGKTLVHEGDPRDAILAAADEVGADLIVMGTHGRRGIRRALLGSVAESVVRHAHVPVLTVHAEA